MIEWPRIIFERGRLTFYLHSPPLSLCSTYFPIEYGDQAYVALTRDMSLFPPHVQSHFTKPCVQSAVGWNERRERANLLRWHTIRNTQSEADICCKRGKKSPLKSQNQSPFHAAISLPKLLQQALLLSSQSINQTIYPIKTVTVLSRCRHFQFRTSKINAQAIRKVQGDRTPHPAETAARLQTEPCKQKPLSRDWYKAADMWTSLLMQPPG